MATTSIARINSDVQQPEGVRSRIAAEMIAAGFPDYEIPDYVYEKLQVPRNQQELTMMVDECSRTISSVKEQIKIRKLEVGSDFSEAEYSQWLKSALTFKRIANDKLTLLKGFDKTRLAKLGAKDGYSIPPDTAKLVEMVIRIFVDILARPEYIDSNCDKLIHLVELCRSTYGKKVDSGFLDDIEKLRDMLGRNS